MVGVEGQNTSKKYAETYKSKADQQMQTPKEVIHKLQQDIETAWNNINIGENQNKKSIVTVTIKSLSLNSMR